MRQVEANGVLFCLADSVLVLGATTLCMFFYCPARPAVLLGMFTLGYGRCSMDFLTLRCCSRYNGPNAFHDLFSI